MHLPNKQFTFIDDTPRLNKLTDGVILFELHVTDALAILPLRINSEAVNPLGTSELTGRL
jgi:hypothetical protein